MLDPVTPPANGDEIARTLTNSLHVRIPSGGHSPDGLTGLECLAELKRGSSTARGRGPRCQLREHDRAAGICPRPLDALRVARVVGLRPTAVSSSHMVMLAFDNLRRRTATTIALRGVSFDVPAGEIFGSARPERRGQEHPHPDPDGHHPRRLAARCVSSASRGGASISIDSDTCRRSAASIPSSA